MSDKVKIDIQTTADTSGATQTEQALARIGKTADKDVDSLKQLQDEMAAIFAAQKSRLDNVATASPSAEAGAAVGSEALLGPAAAAGAALVAVQQLEAAYKAISAAIEHGTSQAAQFSEQLRTLPSDKAQELRDRLGPVADLLDKNSGAIAEYARHSQDAEHATENFWIALSARAIPALNELREASGNPEYSKLGETLGDTVGGGAHIAAQGMDALNAVLGKTGISAEDAVVAFLKWKFPLLGEIVTQLDNIGAAAADSSQKSEAALLAQNAGVDKLSAAASLAASIAQARASALEAQLPLEERLAAVKERQAALSADAVANSNPKSEAEAANLEKVIVAIQAQIDKQKEADDQRRQSQAEAIEDYTRRLALQEATTAGDQKRVDLLKQEIANRQALKATGDDGLAERAAAAVADEQAKRRADADAKAKEAAEKSQARVDELSKKNEESYKKEQEAIAKKREALELETRLNEAKATGNKAEEERLKWLELYNRLREQTDSAGNNIYTEDQARRAANAQTAAQNPATSAYVAPGTKPGDILAGTNFRRGRDQSDSSFAMSEADSNMGGPGGSLLDAYNKTKGLPVGSVGGNNPTASTGKNGAEDVQKAAADLAKQSDNIKSAASTLAAAANSLNGDGLTTLKTAVATLTTQVQALINKV